MGKKKRDPKREFALRARKEQQKIRKQIADRERLAALEPGGHPSRPLEIPSPAVVKSRALSHRCIHCDASLVFDDHSVDRSTGSALRMAKTHCSQCRAPRAFWFKLALNLAN